MYLVTVQFNSLVLDRLISSIALLILYDWQEEDLQETETKIQNKQEEAQLKSNDYEQIKVQLHEVKQKCNEIQKKIASLSLGCDPLKVRCIKIGNASGSKNYIFHI